MLDSLEVYTSGNYGISTVPKTEYDIVVGGGEGLETIQVKQPDCITFVEHVIIPNTGQVKIEEPFEVGNTWLEKRGRHGGQRWHDRVDDGRLLQARQASAARCGALRA